MKAREAAQASFGEVSTDRELLAACGLRPAVIERLYAELGGRREIATATALELRSHGVPPQLAARIAAAFDYARRWAVQATEEPTLIGHASDCFYLFQDLRWRASESFHIAAVDVRNGLIARVEIAIGAVASVEVHPREVFRAAMRVAAAGVVLVHNHPSGDLTPSPEDIALTRRLREVGDHIGIPVIDHVIISSRGFRSICEWMGSTW